MMIRISDEIYILENEVSFTAIRSAGPGGQHTNKVSTAIQLKFDINNSSLPDDVKARLLKINDKRRSTKGIITLKSQKFRSQASNKEDAQRKLIDLIISQLHEKKKRKNTKPSKKSIQKRLTLKKQKSEIKESRKKVNF